MVSKLAKATIEKWWGEGLRPTVEQIVRLNALGLKVESGNDVWNFAACPRVAFLGDWTLFEPTIGKRIWMDTARQLLKDDYQTQIYFTAWALNCPDDELPKMNDVKNIIGAVKKFAEEVIINFTETQLFMAIDYALNGNDPTKDEDFTPEQRTALQEVTTPPDEVMSSAKQLLNEALSQGISGDVKYELTMPQLEKMIICAALSKGADVLKGEHAQNAAKFYAYAGATHKKLVDEMRESTNG